MCDMLLLAFVKKYDFYRFDFNRSDVCVFVCFYLIASKCNRFDKFGHVIFPIVVVSIVRIYPVIRLVQNDRADVDGKVVVSTAVLITRTSEKIEKMMYKTT